MSDKPVSEKTHVQAELDKVFYRMNQLRWRIDPRSDHPRLEQLWENGDGREEWRSIIYVVE